MSFNTFVPSKGRRKSNTNSIYFVAHRCSVGRLVRRRGTAPPRLPPSRLGLLCKWNRYKWSIYRCAGPQASRFLFGLMFVLDSKVIPSNSKQTFSDILVLPKLHASRAFQVGFDFKVIRQYRSPLANPWESLWLFWSYNLDGEGQKLTNYIVFKPNGLEIGKAYKEFSQDFIWTQSQPQVRIGQWHRVLFARKGVNLLLWLDGVSVPLTHLKIESLYQSPGRIALYVEDSQVMLRKVQVVNLKSTIDP